MFFPKFEEDIDHRFPIFHVNSLEPERRYFLVRGDAEISELLIPLLELDELVKLLVAFSPHTDQISSVSKSSNPKSFSCVPYDIVLVLLLIHVISFIIVVT
jgi:hypothetical protein